MKSALTIIRSPTGAYWSLGPLPVAVGDMALIGWRMAAEQEDAGMPRPVAALVSNALVAIARVTFPSSDMSAHGDAWTNVADALVRGTRVTDVAQRIRLRLARAPSTITQVSTRSSAIACRLFDDPIYPWWLGHQVALLSAPESPPPDIDARSLLALLDDDWASHAAELTRQGVRGIVRAGVDGDVLGLLSLVPGFEPTVLDALQTAAEVAGFDWFIQEEANDV